MITEHGGPDALGVPRWDFSTNANACGPARGVVDALRCADLARYPDPAATALREQLAAFHGTSPSRIVMAASASEFIGRMTAAVRLYAPDSTVHVPVPGYGDYARASDAWGLCRTASATDASLVWHTDPASPTGRSSPMPAVRDGAVLVVDQAYAALRLEGEAAPVPPAAWRLVSPNKALGLTGVRGAYALAPAGAGPLVAVLERLAPSWPLGAQGVAMLSAWTEPATQQWLHDSLDTLRRWKAAQLALVQSLGWTAEPSVTPFCVVRAPGLMQALPHLREHGIKLRDTTSMGLPGAVRMAVLGPEAHAALQQAWQASQGVSR